MGFFDHLPPVPPVPEPPRPSRPAWMKPEAALAGVVAEELLLVRTDSAAIAITGLFAYPTGFEFTLSTVLRRESRRAPMFDPGLQHHWHVHHGDEPVPDQFLRLGIQFADGSVATNLDRRAFMSPQSDPVGTILLTDGGGGGGRRYDMRYWVWPLPPPGPLTFVCQWPAYGVAESRVDIDAQLILDAAARAVQLWPEEADASD